GDQSLSVGSESDIAKLTLVAPYIAKDKGTSPGVTRQNENLVVLVAPKGKPLPVGAEAHCLARPVRRSFPHLKHFSRFGFPDSNGPILPCGGDFCSVGAEFDPGNTADMACEAQSFALFDQSYGQGQTPLHTGNEEQNRTI